MLAFPILTWLAGCATLVTPGTDPGDTDLSDTDGGGDGTTNGGDGGGNRGGHNNGQTNGDGSGGDNGGVDTDATSGDATSPMISEIFDGTEHASLQYVEIFNPTRGAISLDGWGLTVGHPPDALTFTFPNVQLASGDTFVVCSRAGEDDFSDLFGFACDASVANTLSHGTDPMALSDATNHLKDIYGPVISAPAGWEFEDSVVKRKAGVFASLSFSNGDWTITDGEDDANPGSRD